MVDLSSFENQIIESLTEELSSTESIFNETVLSSKVKNAVAEIYSARRYPSSYTEEMILADLEKFYCNMRNLALYDYNLVGAEGETSHSENGVSRVYSDRNKIFKGVIPIAII